MELTFPLAMAMNPAGDGSACETDLVAASRRGDTAAFTVLVRRHQKRVFHLAGRIFRRREDVEDAAQDTFLAAWRRLETYRGQAPFEHWITRVCLRCCYARLAAEKRRPAGRPCPEPAGATADPALSIDLETVLGRLKAADRFVLLLIDGEGWSVREVADKTGWSLAAVKVRAFRARRRVRSLLEEKP